jgi:ubiquinone/menaquinone biosynthesis C-methylase UbiE
MPEAFPSGQQILEMMRAFQSACVIGAAAELDVWGTIGEQSLSAEEVTLKMEANLRATTMLLDAVAALNLLAKEQGRYCVPAELRPLLSHGTPQTVLPMVLHSMTILRNWSQLAWVTKAGIPGPRTASIRGFEADRAAFIAAMHTASTPWADELVAKLGPPKFRHLLDVGGASGTWTLAFLRAVPDAKATIFDLPDAVEQARERLAKSEFGMRVSLAAGDFYADELPSGVDYAWVSAICHQHSREHNQSLFAKVFRALAPGGQIAIRDIVMEPSRTEPREGAMFAINMLVNTATGGTFTYEEYAEDLQAAGFVEPQLLVRHEGMNAVVGARKP